MVNAYLLVYNAALCAGWAYCTYLVALTVANGDGVKDLWEVVEFPLKIAQTMAVMEIVHSAIGLVRSPVMITTMQVFSRIWVLWGITDIATHDTTTRGVPILTAGDVKIELSLFTLLTAWGLAEIIRYGFFAVRELGLDIYIMKWLRYSSFVLLYPLGVSSELAMVYLAMPTIKNTGMWSISMPNKWNFGFDYYTLCCILVLSYIPCLPKLYLHMLSQRKRVLGVQRKKSD